VETGADCPGGNGGGGKNGGNKSGRSGISRRLGVPKLQSGPGADDHPRYATGSLFNADWLLSVLSSHLVIYGILKISNVYVSESVSYIEITTTQCQSLSISNIILFIDRETVAYMKRFYGTVR